MYDDATGSRSKLMIGSARLLRSYGDTHGLSGNTPQPPQATKQAIASPVASTNRAVFRAVRLEENRGRTGDLHVVHQLVAAEQVGFEHVIAHVDA